MTILEGKEKKIHLCLPVKIKPILSVDTNEVLYDVDMPRLLCTSEDDAIEIQKKVNQYIYKLSEKMIKKSK